MEAFEGAASIDIGVMDVAQTAFWSRGTSNERVN
jgi:hypothetical protein